MQTHTVTTYTFEELSDEAKEVAISHYREHNYGDTFWSECIIEDAKEVAALMGIDIEDIYWSGFYSQGDGAMFTGSYEYRKGSVKAVKDYAPEDSELQSIATGLYEMQKRNFY